MKVAENYGQLDLFYVPPTKEEIENKEREKLYPWITCWRNWMPVVGHTAQMGTVALKGQGYCYGDRVRILSIDGVDIECVTEFYKYDENDTRMDWKQGVKYNCKISDLWPDVYHQE
jgi:hypothetical protein